jgi:hypothetical protein
MLITVINILGSCISKGHVFNFYVQFSKSEAGRRQTGELVNVVQSCLRKITIGYYPPIEIPLPRPLFPERASGVYVRIWPECTREAEWGAIKCNSTQDFNQQSALQI